MRNSYSSVFVADGRSSHENDEWKENDIKSLRRSGLNDNDLRKAGL